MKAFLNHFSGERKLFRSLRNILGFMPDNMNVYRSALTHRSMATEVVTGFRNSNERLEYLGDAILGAIIADFVFKRFPFREEGFLTEMRSKIVSRDNLNKLSRKLGLDELIRNNPDAAPNKSMHGDALEALIGAIYIDQGYDRTRRFILGRLIKHHLDIDELEITESNFKSKLIEWAQKEHKSFGFEVVEERESGKKKLMKVHALVDGTAVGIGADFSKKRAEQLAAAEACKKLGI